MEPVGGDLFNEIVGLLEREYENYLLFSRGPIVETLHHEVSHARLKGIRGIPRLRSQEQAPFTMNLKTASMLHRNPTDDAFKIHFARSLARGSLTTQPLISQRFGRRLDAESSAGLDRALHEGSRQADQSHASTPEMTFPATSVRRLSAPLWRKVSLV